MKSTLYLLAPLFLSLFTRCTVTPTVQTETSSAGIWDADVTWHTPSKNSLGSMPAGNGDIGINIWAEENGDLLFYLSKTDAWSENGRLLKLGKIRLSFSPNPFDKGKPFLQELQTNDGVIHIKAGDADEQVAIDVWVDAHNPVVELDVACTGDINATVTAELWRTERRKIDNATEKHSAYGLHGEDGPGVFVEKDTILETNGESIAWLHHNQRSIWRDNLLLQGLEKYIDKSQDPLLSRTFGALIRSDKLIKATSSILQTQRPEKRFSISVYALTMPSASMQQWKEQINKKTAAIELKSRKERYNAHKNWWHNYWDRSHIHVYTQDTADKEKIFNLNRGYVLQRYMNACSGRGNSPIKFNGSIFTVDTEALGGQFGGFDADYRRWGGPYWWQNTRLPYWSMLESGDFDLMRPLFKMYRDILPIRQLATNTYYDHQGAFFPETMYFWGTYVDANYGRDRSELPLGMTENRYIRHYWQSGLELSLMMLDYFAFIDDEKFLEETLLPIVSEVVNFYDYHWDRNDDGKILFDPAMALETYNTAVNPLPEIMGIHKVCSELLRLPASTISAAQQNQWKRLIAELPEIPIREIDGKKLLAPAHTYSGKQNMENPELYAIFPYRRFGVGKADLGMARASFGAREFKSTGGWQQNAIKAAYLGLADTAADFTATNFNTNNPKYRFPVMWGPNFDWTPDQDHGSVALIALQRMLLQYDKNIIQLFPAWPRDWNVDFKLHAPRNTIIEGELKKGELITLKVFPEDRRKDIVNHYLKNSAN